MYSESEMQDFYKKYRESLSSQYENSKNFLDQQRRNAYSTIMSSANKAGMLYSNFPQRSKMMYEMNTFQPAQIKLQNTYMTGLDTLRNNMLKYQNSIKNIQDNIAHLNSMT